MDWEPFWRMAIAAALVLPVGLERELRGKPAGLRTHVVVGVAAAALGHVSLLAATTVGGDGDQTRIAAQVVSGIGFMGAGVIFAAGGRVHGLTTAAALWGASAVGLCVGLGSADLALALVTVIILFLWPVDWLAERLLGARKREERTYQVIADSLDGLIAVQQILAGERLRAVELDLSRFGDAVSVRLVLRAAAPQHEALLRRMRDHTEIRFITDEALTDPGG